MIGKVEIAMAEAVTAPKPARVNDRIVRTLATAAYVSVERPLVGRENTNQIA
jgi:hypothetical protein